jgi:hypothetical protein
MHENAEPLEFLHVSLTSQRAEFLTFKSHPALNEQSSTETVPIRPYFNASLKH